ncbi:MAG: TonB-dependent receptor [Bacteroidota bacterium]
MATAIVFCTCSSAALLAQDAGKISGIVVDKATNGPLVGANVILKGTTLGAATDEDGRYFILNIPPGSYELSASVIGYQTVTLTGVVVNIGRTTEADFALEETAVQLGQEVLIMATRPDVVKERTASSEILRFDEVVNTPGVRDLGDLLSLTADVIDGHFRGGREGEELYNLGGMGIVNPLNNAAAFIPIMSAVEEVEVITGGFGAQYGNAQSGVVNIAMKEGNRSRWAGQVESRLRVPGYKHWGNSVFSTEDNPYLQMLDSWEKWAGRDPISDQLFYDSFGFGFGSSYPDSLQAAQAAFGLWQQARRYLNKRYDNLWDRSYDVNLGGPLSSTSRLFVATRVEEQWPVIPTPDADLNYQIMGNIVFDAGDGMTLRFSGAYSNRYGHEFPGFNSRSPDQVMDWLWDTIVGVSRSRNENLQLGVRFTHALSSSTYYDVKVNRVATSFQQGAEVFNPDRFREDNNIGGTWTFFRTPDQFRLGQPDNDFYNERSRTASLDASLTSQVTNSHLLLAGMQFNYYDIDVHNRRSRSSPSNASDELYIANPMELGLYVQDKMEFEGMIANVGLRFDLYDQRTSFYVDPFLSHPGAGQDSSLSGGLNIAERAETPVVMRLQPRFGISFPISNLTVFHLNYGSFLQRPSFERTVYQRITRSTSLQSPVRLGNPQLKPEETNSYEVGIAQSLGEGFTLDVSGYYKDVKNLVQQVFIVSESAGGVQYEAFVNRDYADIRGFRISLTKRRGLVSGALRYNYGVATGKNSSPFDAPVTIFEDPARLDELPDPHDILLDFDRTHNLVLQLRLDTPREWGPSLGSLFPLGDLSVGIKSNIRSGRPFTAPDTTGVFRLNAERTPTEYNTDLRVTKEFPGFFGVRASLYLEIFNLFENQTYSYNTVFQNDRNKAKYLENPDNPVRLKYWDEFHPFDYNQTFLLYTNSPRSYYFGVIIKF